MSTIITPKFSTSNFQSSFQKNLNGFRDLIIVYWIFFLVLIWDWMIGWIRLLTTLCGVHSLTCVTLVCLSCEISVLCFINQGPQCRLVSALQFSAEFRGTKRIWCSQSNCFINTRIVLNCWKSLNWKFSSIDIRRVFPQSPYIASYGCQLAFSNVLVEYVSTRNPRIKFILVIFSFSDW